MKAMPPLTGEGSEALHRPSSAIRTDYDALVDLKKTRGWALLMEVLTKEEATIIKALTASPSAAREVLDFQRASARAVRLLIDLPDDLMVRLASEHQLAENYETRTDDNEDNEDKQ